MPDDPRSAFERLALPYLPSVAFLAGRLCREGADADDLVQETYLRALGGFERFEAGGDLRKWLLTIALNAFRDRMRKRGRDPLALEEAGAEPEAPEPAAAPTLEAVADDRLLRALDGLSAVERSVLTLAVMEGLTRAEIAVLLGRPEGTVRSLLSRARGALRRALAGGGWA